MRDAVQIAVEILGIGALAAIIWISMLGVLYVVTPETKANPEMDACLKRVHSTPRGTEPVPVGSKEIWDYCVKEVSR